VPATRLDKLNSYLKKKEKGATKIMNEDRNS